MIFRSLLARTIALALMVFAPALAAAQSINGLGIKDGSGTSQTLCSYIISSTYQIGCYAPHYWNGSAFVAAPSDSSGRPYGAAPANSYIDGWNQTEGSKSDAACASSGATCSLASILKGILGAVQSTNPSPVYPFQNSSGNVMPTAADNSAKINISTATTTLLVAAVSAKKIHVTGFDVQAAGTGNITFEYGTQTTNPCDTGTTTITGPYNLTAQGAVSRGNGLGDIWTPIPANTQLCAVTSAAVQMSGSVSYAQY